MRTLAAPAHGCRDSRGLSSPRRLNPGVRGGVLSLVLLLVTTACASGTAQTTEGPRPAAQVQAQDLTADTLKALRDAHTQAVAIHDSRAGVEDPVMHRQHRQLLLDTGKALDASWGALATWKASSSGAAPSDVLRPLLAAGPAFCDLAVSLGLLKPAAADTIKAFLAAIPPPPAAHVMGGAR